MERQRFLTPPFKGSNPFAPIGAFTAALTAEKLLYFEERYAEVEQLLLYFTLTR